MTFLNSEFGMTFLNSEFEIDANIAVGLKALPKGGAFSL